MMDGNSDFLNLNIVLSVGDFVYFGIHRPPGWKVVVAEDKYPLSKDKIYNMVILEHGSCTNSQEWFDSLEEITKFYGPFIEKHIPFNDVK